MDLSMIFSLLRGISKLSDALAVPTDQLTACTSTETTNALSLLFGERQRVHAWRSNSPPETEHDDVFCLIYNGAHQKNGGAVDALLVPLF
jgi:hypothetical protein